MDALHFLIGRKWPSASKVGLALAVCTLLSWINVQAASFLPKQFPFLFSNSLISMFWGLLVMAAALLAFATVVGVLVVVPLYTFYRLTGILQSWIRQRAVEEMLGTGMTGRGILDAMVVFGARWWFQASAPSLVLSLALFADLRDLELVASFFAALVAGAAFGYLYLSLQTWSVFPGGKGMLPAILPLLAVPAAPALAVMGLGDTFPGSIVGLAGMILVGRWLAIYGLENWETLSRIDGRTRRAIRRRLPSSPKLALAENPICAREGMRGMDAGALGARLLMLSGFALASVAAFSGEGFWVFAGLLVPAVFINSYRGAELMSQIVTRETESGTLETVRSTPMTSEQFLYGWLRSVVLPQWRDHALLLAGSAAVVLSLGEGERLLSAPFAVMLGASFALPLVGAYIGASIAGQAKARSQISGQLMAAFASAVVIGGPQVAASAQCVSIPAVFVVLGLMTAGVCWLLDAGAKKSLNRVFLPQR